MVEAT
jgi:hypothetical protein